MRMKKLLVALALFACTPLAQATVSNPVVQTTTGYGNGVTTSFTITFDFRANSWLTVTEYDTSTNPTTVTSISQGVGAGKFTVTGGNPGTAIVMGTAPSSTQYLVIGRSIPLTQPVVFNPASIFPYQGLSSQLDQVTLTLQNLNALGGTGGGGSGGGTSSGNLPSPGAAYDFIGWNSLGASTVNATTAYDAGLTTFQSGDILKFNGSGWSTYLFNQTTLMGTLNGSPNTPLSAASGGSGVTNAGTMTWGSNPITFTTSGTTNLTLPTSGTVITGTATNNNTPSTLVSRDSSGNFSSNIVTANGFVGPVTGAVTGNVTGNITGTAALITGVNAIGHGGTGQTTAQAAINALLNTGGSSSATFARFDGANVTLQPLLVGDVPQGFSRLKLAQDTANTVVVNDGSGNMSVIAPGASGNVLTSNGVTWVSATNSGGGGSGSGISYAADTGIANAYVVNPATAVGAYTAGQAVSFLAAHANTGASTINVSSNGVVGVKKPGGGALTAGDILVGQIVTVVYDGTNFQLISPEGPTATANTASTIVARDASGNFAAGTITAALTGHASADLQASSNLSDLGTRQTAVNNLMGAVTNSNYLRCNGTNCLLNTIQAADVPTLNQSTSGNAATATALASAPTVCSGNNWSTGIAANGNSTCAQLAFTNISGTVGASQLPNPSSSTLGGIQSAAAVSHQWINSISTSGVPALSQPAFSDISGTASLTSQVTGTLPVANGGTGVATLATHGVVVGNGTGVVSVTSAGTSGQVLTSNGASADPTYQASTVAVQGQASGSSSTSNTVEAPNYQITNLGSSKYLVETGNDNLLKNPNFQETGITSSVVPDWNIAGSGVVSAIETTTKIGNDPQSLKLTLSSASGDLLYQDVALSGSVSSIPQEETLWINTTVSGLRICPRASATTITSGTSCTSIQANGIWQAWPANILGGSGSVGVSLNAASSSTGVVYVSHGYSGITRNISQISQSYNFGQLKYASTSGCTWSATQTSYAAYSAQASCPAPTVNGSASAPATKIPAVTFTQMPNGDYNFLWNVNVTMSATAYFSCRMVDEAGTQLEEWGISNSNLGVNIPLNLSFPAKVSYTTPQVNKTFSLQCKSSANAVSIVADSSLAAQFVPSMNVFVQYAPGANRLAVQAGQQWQPTIQVLTGSGTYTTPTGVSRIEIEMVGGGGGGGSSGAGGGSGGTGGNTTFGTSLLTANGGVGGISGAVSGLGSAGGTATINSPAFGVALSGGNGGALTGSGIGTSSGAGGVSPFGGAGASVFPVSVGNSAVPATGSGASGSVFSTANTPGGGGGAGGYIKAAINFPSVTYAYSVGAGGTAGSAGSGNAGGVGGSGTIIVKEYYYAANAPQFPGQVSSTTTGQEHIERAALSTICTSGTCSLSSSTPGISSIAWSSTGFYSATFTAGTFSAAPVCVVSGFNSGAANGVCQTEGGTRTSTTYGIGCRVLATGTAQNDSFGVMCMGPR